MIGLRIVQRYWKGQLTALVSSTQARLLLASPYVTGEGADFVIRNLPQQLRCSGEVTVVTDLSPTHICQGATDPQALRNLAAAADDFRLWHLPRLHAKAYISDDSVAIITSANLTAGGLALNYEYGVELSENSTVAAIRQDITAYAALGAAVTIDELLAYCDVANRVRDAFAKQQRASAESARREFARALRSAQDELIRLRLAAGPAHTVFARTVLYLLARFGPMTTQDLHIRIENIHPDLCDSTVDRVIGGRRFGKKWKHAVRTAQQHLKARALIELGGGHWRITPQGVIEALANS